MKTKIPKGYRECANCKGHAITGLVVFPYTALIKCPDCAGRGYVVKVPKRRGK